MLTTLFYFYEGLSEKQVVLTFERLLTEANRSKQLEVYEQWVDASRDRMDDAVYARVWPLEKIDLGSQRGLLLSFWAESSDICLLLVGTCVSTRDGSVSFPFDEECVGSG